LGDEGLSSPFLILVGEIQDSEDPGAFGWVFYLENTETIKGENNMRTVQYNNNINHTSGKWLTAANINLIKINSTKLVITR
jgi:hypothetical protein